MRKPVLLIDDSQESFAAVELFRQSEQIFVEYHIRKFEESCCGELPTTRAPSVIAPEGVFKGLDGVRQYLAIERKVDTGESAYW
jgi:hypothetical protein